MNPEREHLRATLFYNLLGNAIVFDEYSQAMDYREYMTCQGKYCPLLYSLDGRKIGKDAMLERKRGGEPSLSDLPYSFGEYVSGNEVLFPLEQGALWSCCIISPDVTFFYLH